MCCSAEKLLTTLAVIGSKLNPLRKESKRDKFGFYHMVERNPPAVAEQLPGGQTHSTSSNNSKVKEGRPNR